MKIVSEVPAASAWLREMGVPVLADAPPDERIDLLVTGGASGGEVPSSGAVLEFAPRTLKEVLDAVLALGRQVDALPAAMSLLAAGEARLAAVRHALGIARDGSVRGAPPPRAVILTAVDPPVAGGRWLPDLLAHAGASSPLAPSGSADRPVQQADLDAMDVVIAPAASGEARLAHGNAVLVEGLGGGGAGPELYRLVELLAAAVHGFRPDPAPAAGELVRLPAEVPA
jgi:hypothetical protein